MLTQVVETNTEKKCKLKQGNKVFVPIFLWSLV